MLIKSEEKNKNTVVSKKRPSLKISKKEISQGKSNSLKTDTSTVDVSSKKSKRIISRKISRKTKKELDEFIKNNTVQNFDEVTLKDLNNSLNKETLETPLAEKSQTIAISSDKIIPIKKVDLEENLDKIQSTSDKIINNQEKVTELPEIVKPSEKTAEIPKNSKKSKKRNNNDNNKSEEKNVSTLEKNKEENLEVTEKKSSTVIKPNYMIHRTSKARRNISLNLDKNIDELVAPVIKEKDTSINQNASFFYEPSVFQRFNINVTSADLDSTEFDNSTTIIEDSEIENISNEINNELSESNESENIASKLEENINETIIENITPEDSEDNIEENIENIIPEDNEDNIDENIENIIIEDNNNVDITDEEIENLITLDDLFELVNNDKSKIEQAKVSEETLNIENVINIEDLIVNTTSTTFENEDAPSEEDLTSSLEESEEVMQEVADSIITLEKPEKTNIKSTSSVSTFFESSIPSIKTDLSNSQNFATHKKSISSTSSNIFKKFTFDEANLKNTELGINNISVQKVQNNIEMTNALEKFNSISDDLKDLDVSATTSVLTVPKSIDVDSVDVFPTSDTSSTDEVSNDYYNIVTPTSILENDDIEENIFEDKDVLENQISDSDNQDINLDDISIEDLDILENIDVQDLEAFSDEDLDIIDETFVNENPLEDESSESSSIEETFEEYAEDYNNEIKLEEDTFEEDYEEYDFESKKISNTYYTEDEEFSIEDYFGLNDLEQNLTQEEDFEETNEFEDSYEDEQFYEEYEDLDGIELDNNENNLDENSENNFLDANTPENISVFNKLIENFTQTISTLSDRIADLENNKNKMTENKKQELEDTNSPTSEVLESNTIETSEEQEFQEIIDDDEINILDNITDQDLLDNISLDDISIDDISLEDISTLDSNIEQQDITSEESEVSTQEKDYNISELNENTSDISLDTENPTTLDFNLPLNDNGVTEEPNLFDSISADDFNFEDFSLEDLGNVDLNEDTENNKSIEDILTKTFSSENYKNMKNDLLSELEENSDTSPSILKAPEDISSDDATSDFFKIIDTLTKTITELESTPNMENNNISDSNSKEILNVPAELTGEGKAINILINKDDIFSISILNETYEIVADFDGISVLSENIHISTPKKNFFVKVGEKYIEIHNNNDSFLVLTNFEDIEFANAINNVAFAKKNNQIELNIKEAFKLSSINNKIELSMLNTSVADIVNSNTDTSETIDETSVCDNRTLLISEETQKVYLPYTIEEVMKKLNNSKEYQTVEEVIENEYTVPLATFKMPIISRFREAYRFMRVKEKSSVYAAVDLALELMFSSNLNPAVIRAAKDLKELNIYLDCLYENEIEKFDCFKVIYKLLPKIK